MGEVSSRETVAQVTRLRLAIVDNHLKELAADGILRRVQRGCYVPAETHPPPRPVSITETEDSTIVLEIGESVLHLTPREARMIGRGLAGHVDDLRVAESVRQHLFLAGELAATVKSLAHQVHELRKQVV
ncbi:MAG: hypothetical protein PWQ61_1598 [Betaproteobacteria bacterium]|nr:hypothetical protein [Betaproteobacteria bacterium]